RAPSRIRRPPLRPPRGKEGAGRTYPIREKRPMAATLDKDLVTALKAARGGKPMQFAYVPKGPEGKLLVGRKVAPKEVADARKGLGASTSFKGRVVGENGTLVFEVAQEPPPTLVSHLRRRLKEDAGLTWTVVVRVKGDAEADVEGEAAMPAAVPGSAA